MEDKRGRIPDKKDRIPGNKPFCTYKHTPSSCKKMPLGLTCMPIESKGSKLTEACFLSVGTLASSFLVIYPISGKIQAFINQKGCSGTGKTNDAFTLSF